MKLFCLQSHYFFKIVSIPVLLPTSLKKKKVTLPYLVCSKIKSSTGFFDFFKKNRAIILNDYTNQFARGDKTLPSPNTKLMIQTFQYQKRSVIHLHLNLATLPVKKKKGEVNYTDWQFQKKSAYKIIRPLLNLSRADITCFCQSLQLPIYPDKSNQTLYYSRNRIRKQIIPSIQFFLNPQVENAIFQFAEWITKENFLVKYY